MKGTANQKKRSSGTQADCVLGLQRVKPYTHRFQSQLGLLSENHHGKESSRSEAKVQLRSFSWFTLFTILSRPGGGSLRLRTFGTLHSILSFSLVHELMTGFLRESTHLQCILFTLKETHKRPQQNLRTLKSITCQQIITKPLLGAGSFLGRGIKQSIKKKKKAQVSVSFHSDQYSISLSVMLPDHFTPRNPDKSFIP